MSVRCKFKVDSITQHASNGTSVSMTPVYSNNDPNHENSKFWRATPSGELKFYCANPDAVAQLELGAEYYIDITPAAK